MPDELGNDGSDAQRRDAPLIDGFARIAYTMTAALSSVGAAQDLSLTQVRVLGILRDRTMRMSALADYLGLERSSLTGLIDRAVARGLVERRRVPGDGRAVSVTATLAGQTVASEVFAAVAQCLRPRLATLSTPDRQMLARVLQQLNGPEPPSDRLA